MSGVVVPQRKRYGRKRPFDRLLAVVGGIVTVPDDELAASGEDDGGEDDGGDDGGHPSPRFLSALPTGWQAWADRNDKSLGRARARTGRLMRWRCRT